MLETMVRMVATMNQWDKERQAFEENVFSVLEHRKEEMQKKFLKLENMLNDYKEVRLDNMTAHFEKIAGTFNRKIAFNAYALSSGSFGNNQQIVFPSVLLNKGDGYNGATGVFTAPVTGPYFFSAHICNAKSQFVVISIIHEGVAIARTTDYEDNHESCSYVSAPALIKAGENVSIKSSYSNSQLKADTDYRWPSFSGVLLHE